jgi:RNA polymerase sigma factor (sigma-70 family)
VLRDSHDADDCFQATFLVLARKARSLTVTQTLAPWLHSVALRTALKARGEAVRRRQREEKAARPVAVEQPDVLLWRELRPVLDTAVQRLPAKYRDAFVLCCLEGSTVAEAARRLGCPRGTAAARLARAKERLRAGLSRRGVTLGVAALGAALVEGTASARLPAALVASTVRVAGRFATTGAAAAGVETFRAAAARTMVEVTRMTRTRTVVALLVFALVGVAAMRFSEAPSGYPPTPISEQAPVAQGPRVRFLSLAEALALARRPAVVRCTPLTVEGEQVRNEILKEVEGAYWDLYVAYWKLHSREQGLRLAYEIWKPARENGGVNPACLARIRGQYELFRGQRLAAKGAVAKAAQELRKRLNLSSSDKTELVPCDAPSLAPFHPRAYKALVREALTRPEVRLAHERFVAALAGQILGRRDSLTPVGQTYQALKDEEMRAEQFLNLCWRRLFEYDEQIRAQRAQREAFGLQLRLDLEGQRLPPYDDLVFLEGARFYTEALANEYEAIASGAKNRCNFAFARGKLLEYDRDRFGGDLLRAHVGKELLERERKRTSSLIPRASAQKASALEIAYGTPPSGGASSLPALWKAMPPLKEVAALPPDGAAQPRDCPLLVPCTAAELFPSDASEKDRRP